MINTISRKTFFILITIILCSMYIIYHYSTSSYLQIFSKNKQHSFLGNNDNEGWISPSFYNELRSYIKSRKNTINQIKRPVRIQDKNITVSPLNYDYIELLKTKSLNTYPYSTWKCSNTSNTDYKESGEYCVLTNIYYNSSIDEYYFYQDPSKLATTIRRDIFMTSYGEFKLNIIDDITYIIKDRLSAVLTRPVLVAGPPDANYAHGFLEVLGPRFWVVAECQSHPSYVDPAKIQVYYASRMFKGHPNNWGQYERQSDGTYRPRTPWEQLIQSIYSIYPLLIYTSFNDTTVMFKYMLFTGQQLSRSSSWGYTYPTRKFRSYPFSTQHYRRAYLSYSEWILYNFNLKSKFELTSIQEELQQTKSSEKIPICSQTCIDKQQKNMTTNEFHGEWIVVLNRAGVGRREITNAGELVQALLKMFPDQSNPYLRVWPKQFNFNDNIYETARMARSIRLIIGVHGAGLSNTLFMRPGAVLYEINPYGCRDLSFNFRRWADVFNLQHALWIPSQGANGNQDESCDREGSTTLNVNEITDEVKNLLKNEVNYRNGYLRRALDIMNDMSITDQPPSGFENIFK